MEPNPSKDRAMLDGDLQKDRAMLDGDNPLEG
jgi:hypothetical protein